MLNTVEISQIQTIKNEYIGKSTGLPNMLFELNIRLKIKTTIENYELNRNDVEQLLIKEAKKYFNPIYGGEDGKGFPMGKDITKADLYKLINRVDSSLYFDDISINGQDKLKLDYMSIVRFVRLDVEDMSYDF